MSVPNFLQTLFSGEDMFGHNLMLNAVFDLMAALLSWDIVKGGLVFILGLGIALLAVNRIRQGFGV
jgi:hypothetical protein